MYSSFCLLWKLQVKYFTYTYVPVLHSSCLNIDFIKCYLFCICQVIFFVRPRYMRLDRIATKILNFLKSINLQNWSYPFWWRPTLKLYTYVNSVLFQKHWSNASLCIVLSWVCDHTIISTIFARLCPLSVFWGLGNIRNSQEAFYGECGGFRITKVLCFSKNFSIRRAVHAGALSCYKIHQWFLQSSGYFLRIASRK